MNPLRKLMLFALLVVLGSMTVKAADPLLLTLGYVNKVIYKYWSVDANNNPVQLSEMIYYNKYYSNFKQIFVSNHPTTTSNDIAPTGSDPQIEEVAFMCDGSDRCLVVAPDYLGYGATVDSIHPYMCSTLTARNVVDGIVAAINYVKTQKTNKSLVYNGNKSEYYTFEDTCSTLNVGYSQGGATTLAVHKYLETEAPESVKKLVNLRKSICGAGPHLQTLMFDEMEPQDDIYYSLYIPYIIDGLRTTFANSTMRGITEEEIYTENFLKSGLLEKMRAKATIAADLNQAIADYFGGKAGFYDIIRPEYKDRSSKLYRTLHKALKQCDLLDGWKPTKPITFYHYTQDGVVPYQESVKAYNCFKSQGCNVDFKNAEDVDVESVYKVKSYDETHMGYGTKFYLSIFSGTLR